jgi:hypothetical protein
LFGYLFVLYERIADYVRKKNIVTGKYPLKQKIIENQTIMILVHADPYYILYPGDIYASL